MRILPRKRARRIKIGTYKVKLSFGVLRSNSMSTLIVETLTLSANLSATPSCLIEKLSNDPNLVIRNSLTQ